MKCMTGITTGNFVDRAETDLCSELRIHTAQTNREIVQDTGIGDMLLVDTVTCCGA